MYVMPTQNMVNNKSNTNANDSNSGMHILKQMNSFKNLSKRL